MAEYSDEDIMKTFKLYDIENEDVIRADDLKEALRSFSNDIKADPEDIRDVLAALQNPAKLTFDNFKEAVCRVELHQAFRSFDKLKQGWISKDLLREILRPVVGDDVSEDEMEDIINSADQNGDNQIDIQEFVDLMMSD